MPEIFNKLTAEKSKDIKVLAGFVSIYCREQHRDTSKSAFPVRDARLEPSLGKRGLMLCADCQRLLDHGIAKLMLCEFDPKPMCKKCPKHCYAPGYREKMREVMRFSGLYLIKHGRIDLLLHYYR